MFSLTGLQSSSLLLATSKILLRRHICLSRIFDLVIYRCLDLTVVIKGSLFMVVYYF